MARYIDAEEALRQIKVLQETDTATVGKKQFAEGFFCGLDEAEVILMRTSTADVEEVKHAYRTVNVGHRSYCSNCGRLAVCENYCSLCGAKMDGKDSNVPAN